MPIELAASLIELCRQKKLRLTTAESCTGGLIAATLTDIPGASDAFDRGFITYSNQSKMDLLDVEEDLLAAHGAVSEPVARAMAQGAIIHSGADLTVAVTGIAGPGGGSPEKPVGLVFIAVASRFGRVECEEHVFPGSRGRVRMSAVETALQMLYDLAKSY